MTKRESYAVPWRVGRENVPLGALDPDLLPRLPALALLPCLLPCLPALALAFLRFQCLDSVFASARRNNEENESSKCDRTVENHARGPQ